MPVVALLNGAKLLERLEGDKELMEEVFIVFISEAPERRTKIAEALQTMDMDTVARLSHALKGAAATLVAEPLREACAALEASARNKDAAAVAFDTPRVLDLLERTTEFMAGMDVASL